MGSTTLFQIAKIRSDGVQSRWDESVGWSPPRAAWGMCSFSNLSGGGGIAWFATREDLFAFIEEVVPFNPGGSDDPFIVAEVCRALVANIRHGVFDDATGMSRLNDALKSSLDIRWIGTLEELCSDDSPFPNEVRAWYHERITDDDDELVEDDYSPITIDETDEFTDELCEYGL